MPSFQTSRRVAHKAAQMFALVADVERYPEFVPLCEGLQVKSRLREGEAEIIVATMSVGYKMFRESFTSRVQLWPERNVIFVNYLDGPFRYLENRWTFTPIDAENCEIGFHLSYEFRSRALQMLMGSVFDRAFRKFADAFEARADELYGRQTREPSLAPSVS
jgi:coenzyme Q-binding protein COQ10